MAHSHFRIIGVTEDVDTECAPRIRAQVEDFKPRSFNCNLTKADAARINQLKALVGGDCMIPGREGKTADGVIYFILDLTQEIIPIHQPDKIHTAKTVDFVPTDKKVG